MRYDINKNNTEIIDYAMAHGINYFETCYFYLDHQCENFVYSLLQKYNRESYEICGKMSMSEAFNCKSSFKDLYYEQLNRVPGHYFDVYLLQALRPEAYFWIFTTDLIDFLLQEKEKGHIKRFGFSEQCDNNLLSKFLTLNCWDIAQMPLNYYDWYLCEKNKNYNSIIEHNIPIIAQSPFKGGHLIKDLPQEAIKLISQQYQRTPQEVALDFVIDKKPEIILTGCTQLATLKEVEKACNTHSPIMDEKYLVDVLNLYKQQLQIPCLLCDRCIQVCPQKINLPLHISMFNKTLYNLQHFESLCQLKYFSHDPISQCIYCNQCVNVCPLHTNIPNRLIDIFNLRP